MNLHGIDLDPRAVQIAAAALWMKARQVAPEAKPERMNLVASNLRLAGLPEDDEALLELKNEVERETGIKAELTETLIQALRGADHLGSLLRVDRAVEEALTKHEEELGRALPEQGGLFTGFGEKGKRKAIGKEEARATLLDRLEAFLAKHSSGEDLGLRLRGEQLAAGGRRAVRPDGEGGDVRPGGGEPAVPGDEQDGGARVRGDDVSAREGGPLRAFILRGLELVRKQGVSAMLTMRNWMFIKQFAAIREHLLSSYDLRSLGDFAVGAFDEVPNDVLSVAVSCLHRARPRPDDSVASQPTPPSDVSYDRARTARKRAATLCHVGHHTFDPVALKVVPDWPLVY